MERKTITVTMATKQFHFASFKKKTLQKLGFSLSVISCEQGAM